jgi:hypothetical protein
MEKATPPPILNILIGEEKTFCVRRGEDLSSLFGEDPAQDKPPSGSQAVDEDWQKGKDDVALKVGYDSVERCLR